jgi:thymidine kinase
VSLSPDGKVEREGQQIEVGGNELYVSPCRKHFSENIRIGMFAGRRPE